MAQFPRGIAPELLVSQVRNTLPYLFEEGGEGSALEALPPVGWVREFDASVLEGKGRALSHFEYFRLCVSAHYLTCATPVPTDVDNQIRRKLWPSGLPLQVALQMSELVLECRGWDYRPVSARFSAGAAGGPFEAQTLDGHLGEWFTLAAGAYCALRQYAEAPARERCEQLLSQISDEVDRHSEIFGSLWRAHDGLGCLKASASVAHNLGDLDRVMDMWELSVADPLRLRFYKLGSSPFDSDRKLRYLGRLWVAGELYKSEVGGSSMALENHRHFALRKPRCLRQSPAFLVPLGPFFDDWGKTVATGLSRLDGTPGPEIQEVVEALIHGRSRLPKTFGYGRALHGIRSVHPGLPFEGPGLVEELKVPRDAFEKRWNEQALQRLDEIPSRA